MGSPETTTIDVPSFVELSSLVGALRQELPDTTVETEGRTITVTGSTQKHVRAVYQLILDPPQTVS
jgi:hypothetical protein